MSWRHTKPSSNTHANNTTDFFARINLSADTEVQLSLDNIISIKCEGNSNQGSGSFDTLSENHYLVMNQTTWDDWRMKYKVRFGGDSEAYPNYWTMEITFRHTGLINYWLEHQGTYEWSISYGKWILEYLSA